jgi:peroxiredoxin
MSASMTRSVTLGGHAFRLTEEPARVGEIVSLPGAGVRALYVAPSLERWSVAAAEKFAGQVRQLRNAPDLFVMSADHQPIAQAWAEGAGWQALRFDEAMVRALGLWIEAASLPARALMIVDASGRLKYCDIALRLEDEIAFDDALLPLKTFV